LVQSPPPNSRRWRRGSGRAADRASRSCRPGPAQPQLPGGQCFHLHRHNPFV